ncbi:hypothetical protein NE237_017452 [Protea cynaroides]|uniref:Diacylglycerol O-acyltransferase n=1 Tax=Protea cynaroides TaxID=273540 RepID=A0A9Q0K829_9MAGN|nr:hypothetical protein NE237_017452 [Protea cynaroides]
MAEELLPPLSPLSQSFNTPIMPFTIIVVLEFEKPFNKSQIIEILRDLLIPISPRFSCIIFTDNDGVKRWKKVDLTIEDHIIIPTFPSGSSSLQDCNDKHFFEYLSQISMDQLPQNQPPWEVHAIMYPTSNATMSLVFRLNHALGDGYSLMSTLFSSFKRVDDPLLPITFPVASSSSPSSYGRMNSLSKVSSFISRCVNTVSDSIMTLLQGMFLEDDKTVIRSVTPRLEFVPRTILSVTFDLDEIRQVKNIVGGTVNDVIIGLISFTIRLYMQKLESVSGNKRVSALVMMNMRMLKGYQNVEDLSKANEWGNQFGLLIISLPLFSDSKNVSPLEFIIQAKKEMRKKMNLASIHFSAILMNILKNIMGSKAVAGLMYSTGKNTSLGISNIIGPMQKVALADNPLNGFYFTVGGVPQSLNFTVMSYMGKLRVITISQKGFIDSELLISCMKEAYGNILEETHKKRAAESS